MGRKDTDPFKINIDDVLTEFDEINKGMLADKSAEADLKVEIKDDIRQVLEEEAFHNELKASAPKEPVKKSHEEFYDEDDYADDENVTDDESDTGEEDCAGREMRARQETEDAGTDEKFCGGHDVEDNEGESHNPREKQGASGKRFLLIGAAVLVCAALAAGGIYLAVHQKTTKQTSSEPQQTAVAKTDTTPPEVIVSPDIRVAVGAELSSNDVIESMQDNADIIHIAFVQNGVQEGNMDEFHVLGAAACRYDQTGEFTNVIQVTDAFNNVAEVPIQIYVTEDYAARVQQLTDKVIVQNSEGIDFMKDVTWDESVATVTCDPSQVNMGAEGLYPLEYVVMAYDADPDTGRTGTTVVVTKTVQIVSLETAQSMADAGGIVYTSGNAELKASEK